MNILVTGGAGFIGSHLCEELLTNGHYVKCVDVFDEYYPSEMKKRNLSLSVKNPNFELHELDILNLDDLLAIREISSIDCVFHLAARPGVQASMKDPIGFFDNNIRGTQNILELCRKVDVDKLILTSSSSVYGNRTEGPFRETDSLPTPASPYAASKLVSEILSQSYHRSFGLNVVCIRPFTVYGPRQRPDMAIHHFVDQIVEERRLHVFGKRDSSRDYTYVGDLVQGMIATIDVNTGYEVFNLGSSHPIELEDLVMRVLEKTGIDVEITWRPERAGDVRMTYADITKAREILGFNPCTSIDDGLIRFIDWYKEMKRPSF